MIKKAMLAHKFDDKRVDWSQPVYIQPKLDGVRCLIKLESDNTIKAYSRAGKEFKNVKHIIENLQPFFKMQPHLVLDGELYNHELKNDFEKIISLVRKTKPTEEHRIEAAEMVQFHCYDYFSTCDCTKTGNYKERMHALNVANFYDKCIKHVPALLVDSYNYARIIHAEFLKDGYEGSIIRLDGPYKHGRSYDLMKFKDFSDAEATIIGYEIGKGKREGHLGKFIMQDDNGVEFGCPPGKGYTYEDMKEMLENIKDYIGERATFTYFQRTKAGSYRHPLFKCLRNYE